MWVVRLALREDRNLHPRFCVWVSNIARRKICDVMKYVKTITTEIYR
jgi:hypothetical protein